MEEAFTGALVEVEDEGEVLADEAFAGASVEVEEVGEVLADEAFTGTSVEVEESGWGARMTGWPFKTVVAPHPVFCVAASGPF